MQHVVVSFCALCRPTPTPTPCVEIGYLNRLNRTPAARAIVPDSKLCNRHFFLTLSPLKVPNGVVSPLSRCGVIIWGNCHFITLGKRQTKPLNANKGVERGLLPRLALPPILFGSSLIPLTALSEPGPLCSSALLRVWSCFRDLTCRTPGSPLPFTFLFEVCLSSTILLSGTYVLCTWCISSMSAVVLT